MEVSRLGGGGGTGPRLGGGGGGAEDLRSPTNGGGTLNIPCGSSSMGVFGGRGGGGGPGFAKEPEEARARPEGCRAGPSFTAYLPASAMGGGARKRGCGLAAGDGVRGGGDGDRGGDGALPPTGLRDGGGAGGGPRRLDEVVPVFSGLILEGGADGGGGGGPLDLESVAVGKA